jgi:hypothetical protein
MGSHQNIPIGNDTCVTDLLSRSFRCVTNTRKLQNSRETMRSESPMTNLVRTSRVLILDAITFNVRITITVHHCLQQQMTLDSF